VFEIVKYWTLNFICNCCADWRQSIYWIQLLINVQVKYLHKTVNTGWKLCWQFCRYLSH